MYIEDNKVAAVIIFILALFGMSCQWFIVFFIRRIPTLQNAFGRLTAAQSFGEAIHLSIFTFFVAPMVYTDAEWMVSISRHFGHILLVCYDICIYCHFAIACNRFTAIVFPMKYESLFNQKKTSVYITIAFVLAIVPSLYFYLYEDCHFYYLNDYWHFIFTNNEICNFITWYTDFMKYVSVVVIIVTIDLITVSRVHALNAKSFGQAQPGREQFCKRTRQRELNFLKQACLEAFVFVCELLTYFVIIGYADGTWPRFFLTTFAWITVHTCDGLITIIFNKEFRAIFARIIRGQHLSQIYSTDAKKTTGMLSTTGEEGNIHS